MENIMGKNFIPISPTLFLIILAINSYRLSKKAWIFDGITFKHLATKNINAQRENDMIIIHKLEFVKLIS